MLLRPRYHLSHDRGMFVIEAQIPLPVPGMGKDWLYQIADMGVNDQAVKSTNKELIKNH